MYANGWGPAGWKPVLEKEMASGLFKGPIELEVMRRFKSELYADVFPEGHMVMVTSDGDPAVSTTSIIWEIPFDGEINGVYPRTWGMVSNNGYGYPRIQKMSNGSPADAVAYDDLPQNKNDKHILINYALTTSDDKALREKLKEMGILAVKLAVEERSGVARKKHTRCHTFSPMSGFGKWYEKYHENYRQMAERDIVDIYIDKNILDPFKKGEQSEFFGAGRMHVNYGAKIIGAIENGRPCDTRSRGWCIVTEYPCHI